MTFWRQGWDRLSPQDATASEAVFAHGRMGGSEICLCSWKHHKLNCSFVGMCLRSTAIVHGQCMSGAIEEVVGIDNGLASTLGCAFAQRKWGVTLW